MNCVLVLGTPRSGTSCVAGVLHHLGVPMGERLIPADEWNQGGYFQDYEFEDLAGYFEPNFNGTRVQLNITDDELLGQVAGLIERRNREHLLWGLKSQRIAHFIPLLAEMTELKVIRTYRPKNESVSSWSVRSNTTMTEAGKVIEYMDDLITAKLVEANITPLLEIDFRELILSPKDGVARIASAVGLTANKSAVEWVQPSLVRF